MFETDKIKIQILTEGTIKVETDPVSPENHANAEEFLQLMAKLAGGKTTRDARHGEHHHGHGHTHSHSHGDEEHQH